MFLLNARHISWVEFHGYDKVSCSIDLAIHCHSICFSLDLNSLLKQNNSDIAMMTPWKECFLATVGNISIRRFLLILIICKLINDNSVLILVMIRSKSATSNYLKQKHLINTCSDVGILVYNTFKHINGLVQERHNSSALAMELCFLALTHWCVRLW